MVELRPEFRFSSQIWTILPGFGPYSLDWGPKQALSPKGGAGGRDGRTDGQTNGQTDSPCVLQDFVPFGAAAQKPTYASLHLFYSD